MYTRHPITQRLHDFDDSSHAHHSGSIHHDTFAALEDFMGGRAARTAETGCGRSTLFFSLMSDHHTTFCLNDKTQKDSSLAYAQSASFEDAGTVNFVLGPTQKTLMAHDHTAPYDAVLIDGPHGFPFPELEYFFFYPHIRTGGLLIVDDVHLPTVAKMADVLQEDVMWDLLSLERGKTAVFRRTDAPLVPPTGDHCWVQGYNQHRLPDEDYALPAAGQKTPFLEQVELYRNPPANGPAPARPKRPLWKKVRRWLKGRGFS